MATSRSWRQHSIDGPYRAQTDEIDELNRASGNGGYGVEPALVGSVVTQVTAGRIDPGLAGRGPPDLLREHLAIRRHSE